MVATVVLVLAGAPIVLATPASAQVAGEEQISGYTVEIRPRADGSMLVSERIRYDFGGTARHGIVRDIDNRQRYDRGRNRVFPIRDVAVTAPTAPAQFVVSESGGEVHIRIGDPNRTVTGTQEYTITYTVLAATTRLPDHDELYWNAVGPGWSVPVQAAAVQVVAETSVLAATCYAGPVGTRSRCGSASKGSSQAQYAQPRLEPGDALTVVASFPSGSVAAAAPVLVDRLTVRRFLARQSWPLAAGAAIVAVGVFALVRRRRRSGAARAQIAASVSMVGWPETSPPDGIPPGLAGLLLAQRSQRQHAVATLTDLAARGYLSIEPLGAGQWRMRALRGPDHELRPWEDRLLTGVFERSLETTLQELGPRLGRALGRTRDDVRDEAIRLGWLRPGAGWRFGYPLGGCLLVVLGFPLVIVLGVVAGAGAVGIAMLIAGVLLLIAAAFGPPRLTPAGAAMRARVDSFFSWLARADPATLPPAQQEPTLRRFLPYAVAAGFVPVLVRQFAPFLPTDIGYGTDTFTRDASAFSSDVHSASSVSASGSDSSSGFSSSGSSGDGGGGGGGSSW
jgi:uncharacterized membrane protein YgcG